jgi:uncharacterized protein with FMN-binding domain
MKSINTTTPAIVGALAMASIIGAAAFVLMQSQPKSQAQNLAKVTTTSQTTAIKETTTQPTDTQTVTAPTPSTDTTTNTPVATTQSSGYKDGTYTASASYGVPHGQNSIEVSITLKNGTVTSVKNTHGYSDRESGRYIDSFDTAIESSVVGAAIEGLSLSRVAGASLTTYGFDDALASIANQAKA